MRTKKVEFEKIIEIWHGLIEQQSQALRKKLNDLEVSSLSACIGDCYESFHEIYFELIPALQQAIKNNDYDTMQTLVLDIYWAFDHIKNHVVDASKGFLELSEQLEKKEDM